MPGFPSREDFTQRLLGADYLNLLSIILSQDAPYAFAESLSDYGNLCRALAKGLGVQEQQLIMVGSGKLGFSLNPSHYGRPFQEDSDLDFAVISEPLFDDLWFDLLRMPPSRFSSLKPQVKEWVQTHRTNRIYFGRATPHTLLRATPIAQKWFQAFAETSSLPGLAQHRVHGMLFRTRAHLDIYHQYGLRQVRRLQQEALQ